LSDRVAVAGISTAVTRGETDLKSDEVVFGCVSAALREAGLRAQDVGLAMLSSLDLYDGRAISNGLVVPAAAGYLQDESRIESDSTLAITAAAASIRARQVEAAVVVAIHMPEIEGGLTDDPTSLRAFTDRISALTFDAVQGRPLGMTSTIALSMQAAYAEESGKVSRNDLARRAARDISAGAASAWSNRTTAVTAEEVLAADAVSTHLTELMLPGEGAGIIAMVLASEPRIRRARSIRGWISGWGVASSPDMSIPEWLEDPGASTRVAAKRAFAQSGLESADEVGIVELTALTPAMEPYLEEALGIKANDERTNRAGGALSSFPGVASGALRVAKAFEGMAQGGQDRALVHATDNLMGPVSAASSVLVLEKP
jgi:hypothetical protein